MVFPEGWDAEKVRKCYNNLLIEQDADSPNCYKAPGFEVHEGEVIADVGAAEGIWALSNADKAGKIYLFECEEKWKIPLEMTFAPYRDKTHIIKKYVCNITEGDGTTLDDFLDGEEINFIKADIEGAEVGLLEGAKKTLGTNGNLRIMLCTYHRHDDANILQDILRGNGFSTAFSNGYMLFMYDPNLCAPYLRRGLIRAAREMPLLSKEVSKNAGSHV
jgi:hypothetical protein